MPFKNILIPVDFSDSSRNAVEYGLHLAEQFCAQITLCHCIVLFQEDLRESENMATFTQAFKAREAERSELLKERCAHAQAKGLKINSLLLRGVSAADVLLDHINDSHYDLIIMGTHGHTGMKKWLFGSVAEKVVRHAPAPVLTVRKDWTTQAISHVLVPVDFSAYSKKAIGKGLDIAIEHGARITFLHAVEQETHPAFYATQLESVFKTHPSLKRKIREKLVQFAEIPEEDATFAVAEGKAHAAIRQYVQEHDIDMLVMAVKGLGAIDHLRLGSNVERVLKSVDIPTMTVGRKLK